MANPALKIVYNSRKPRDIPSDKGKIEYEPTNKAKGSISYIVNGKIINLNSPKYSTKIGQTLQDTFENSLNKNLKLKTPTEDELDLIQNIVKVYANKEQEKSLNWAQRDTRVNQILEDAGNKLSNESYAIIDSIFDVASKYRKGHEDHSSYFTEAQIQNFETKTALSKDIKSDVTEKLNKENFTQTELECIYKVMDIYSSGKKWDDRRAQIETIISKNAQNLSDEAFDLLEQMSHRASETKYVQSIYGRDYSPNDYHKKTINSKLEKLLDDSQETIPARKTLNQILGAKLELPDKIEHIQSFINAYGQNNQETDSIPDLEYFKSRITEFTNIVRKETLGSDPELNKKLLQLRNRNQEKIIRRRLRIEPEFKSLPSTKEKSSLESLMKKKKSDILFFPSIIMFHTLWMSAFFKHHEKIEPFVNQLMQYINNF